MFKRIFSTLIASGFREVLTLSFRNLAKVSVRATKHGKHQRDREALLLPPAHRNG